MSLVELRWRQVVNWFIGQLVNWLFGENFESKILAPFDILVLSEMCLLGTFVVKGVKLV